MPPDPAALSSSTIPVPQAAASAPQTAPPALGPAGSPSSNYSVFVADPRATSASAGVPLGTSAITVQLPPQKEESKYLGMEPAMWAPVATGFAVIATSIITLIVSARTIKAANQKMKVELEEARQKAHTDRVTEARREIYGEVMTDFQKVQAFLGSMTSEDFKPADALVLSIMSASVNKLWIWGDIEAAYAAREFYSQVNEFYHEALARALAIYKTRDMIAKVKANEVKYQTEFDALNRELREHHDIPVSQRDTEWTHKANRLDREQQMAGTDRANQQRTWSSMMYAMSIKQDEYLDFIISRQTALMNQINVVMSLARADVGLGGDVEKLNEQSHQMSRRATEAVKNLKEAHEREMESMRQLFR